MESGTDVVGREEEVAALADFLDVRARLPAVLLLEGEAGIGKTTLWRHGVELAAERGYRVLSCSGSSSEAQLSFVGLGDLLGDALQEVLPALPSPQANALAVALFLADAQGSPPDQRAIALGFTEALRLLGRAQPVAVAIDDLQWLNRPSGFVLQFALRRLRGAAVAFLFTLRQDEHATTAFDLERAVGHERLAQLPVGPLSLGAIHRLLSDRLDVVMSRPKLRRLRELSGGNPLFALELGRAVQREAIRLEAVEPLPGTLACVVRDRLLLLPPDTRVALRAASALSHPTLELVSRVVGGGAADRLTPAIEGHIVELDREHIRFTHPLLASGIYTEAAIAERRALPPPAGGAASRLGGAGPASRARGRGPGRGCRLRPRARGPAKRMTGVRSLPLPSYRACPPPDAGRDGREPAPPNGGGRELCLGGGRSRAGQGAVERGSFNSSAGESTRRGPRLARKPRGVRGRPSQSRRAVPRGSAGAMLALVTGAAGVASLRGRRHSARAMGAN